MFLYLEGLFGEVFMATYRDVSTDICLHWSKCSSTQHICTIYKIMWTISPTYSVTYQRKAALPHNFVKTLQLGSNLLPTIPSLGIFLRGRRRTSRVCDPCQQSSANTRSPIIAGRQEGGGVRRGEEVGVMKRSEVE